MPLTKFRVGAEVKINVLRFHSFKIIQRQLAELIANEIAHSREDLIKTYKVEGLEQTYRIECYVLSKEQLDELVQAQAEKLIRSNDKTFKDPY